MKKLIALAIIAVLVPACAMQYKKTEQEMKQPINCATAEGDLRALAGGEDQCCAADSCRGDVNSAGGPGDRPGHGDSRSKMECNNRRV